MAESGLLHPWEISPELSPYTPAFKREFCSVTVAESRSLPTLVAVTETQEFMLLGTLLQNELRASWVRSNCLQLFVDGLSFPKVALLPLIFGQGEAEQ